MRGLVRGLSSCDVEDGVFPENSERMSRLVDLILGPGLLVEEGQDVAG